MAVFVKNRLPTSPTHKHHSVSAANFKDDDGGLSPLTARVASEASPPKGQSDTVSGRVSTVGKRVSTGDHFVPGKHISDGKVSGSTPLILESYGAMSASTLSSNVGGPGVDMSDAVVADDKEVYRSASPEAHAADSEGRLHEGLAPSVPHPSMRGRALRPVRSSPRKSNGPQGPEMPVLDLRELRSPAGLVNGLVVRSHDSNPVCEVPVSPGYGTYFNSISRKLTIPKDRGTASRHNSVMYEPGHVVYTETRRKKRVKSIKRPSVERCTTASGNLDSMLSSPLGSPRPPRQRDMQPKGAAVSAGRVATFLSETREVVDESLRRRNVSTTLPRGSRTSRTPNPPVSPVTRALTAR